MTFSLKILIRGIFWKYHQDTAKSFKLLWYGISKNFCGTALTSMRKTRFSVLVIYWIIQHSIFLLKFKGRKMANIRNAGRPCRTITLNFNKVDDTVNEVLSLCLG